MNKFLTNKPINQEQLSQYPTTITQELQSQISTITNNLTEVKEIVEGKFTTILQTITQNSTVKQVQNNTQNINSIQKQIYIINQQLQLLTQSLSHTPNNTQNTSQITNEHNTNNSVTNDCYMSTPNET